MLVSDEIINLESTDCSFVGTIFEYVYGITLRIDVGTELVFLDGSFGVFNNGNLKSLFLRDSLGSTDGKVLGYN